MATVDREVSEFCRSVMDTAEEIWGRCKTISPAIAARLPDGREVLCPILGDMTGGNKDLVSLRMQELVKLGAEEIVFAAESWIAMAPKGREKEMRRYQRAGRLEEYPGRKEAIMLAYHSPTLELVLTLEIGEDRSLAEAWEASEDVAPDGRFAGIFRKAKAREN